MRHNDKTHTGDPWVKKSIPPPVPLDTVPLTVTGMGHPRKSKGYL